MEKIVIVDFEMGNLHSVKRAVQKLGYEATVSGDPEVVLRADKIIIPGVGHFAAAVKNLRSLGLWDALNERVLSDNVPVLGICLGMQLMCSYSEEGNVEGFGWFKARCSRFEIEQPSLFKVPQIGWNTVSLKKQHILFEGVKDDEAFYFLHSYAVQSDDYANVIGESEYGQKFHSVLALNKMAGVQFHPEKSHEAGKMILKNFITRM